VTPQDQVSIRPANATTAASETTDSRGLLVLPTPILADALRAAASADPASPTWLPRVTFEPQATAQDPPTPVAAVPLHRRHTARAFIEIGGFMSYSMTNYWRKYASFIEDWQFQLTWKDQTRKWFTSEGLRLDSNNMRLNWTHGAAGALYYSIARTNGFGAKGALLFSAGGSLLWEYGAEWREISSINDHIFTSVGGMAIAEPFFQIGRYFRNREGLANRIGGFATNPMVAIDDMLDGKRRAPRVPEDQWHSFMLSTGALRGVPLPDSDTSTQQVLNLDMAVVTLPSYGKVGTGSGRASRTLDSAVHIDANAVGLRIEEFTIRTRTTLFGHWWKNVREDERGNRYGHDLWIGAQLAWDVFQKKPIAAYDGHDLGMKDKWLAREQPTHFTDKISSVHFPGPTLSLTTYRGRLRTRIDVGAALNFSLVNALSFNDYSATHDTWGVKTTLHNWGYYYAIGSTLTARAEAEYGIWRASAGVDYRHFGSIQGLDRYQHDVTDDSRLRDSRLVAHIRASVQVPKSPIFAAVKVEAIDRRGSFHETTARAHETRVSYEVGIGF
jgi:hypothetical protein